MARKSFKRLHVFPYCAEHTHEIRSFAQADVRYAALDLVNPREFERINAAAATQAVAAVKRNLRQAGLGKVKVGHGGTLDPLASGVLPIALGEATKLAGAGGTKGTVDVAVADQLLGKIDEISEIFWETKKA